jgi:hypothetical protein
MLYPEYLVKFNNEGFLKYNQDTANAQESKNFDNMLKEIMQDSRSLTLKSPLLIYRCDKENEWRVMDTARAATCTPGSEHHINFAEFLQRAEEGKLNLSVIGIKNQAIKPLQMSKIVSTNSNLSKIICALSFEEYWDSIGFQALLKGIEFHPQLKNLYFMQTFTEKQYALLEKLLDVNYRIESISFLVPDDEKLINLDQKLRARLAEGTFERFKKERLSQDKLLALAEDAITSAEKNQYLELLLQSNSSLPSSDTEEERNQKEAAAYENWPFVYKNNKAYLQGDNWSLMQLDIHKKVEKYPNSTVGYYLLKKAVAAKNPSALHYLLNLGANLFEQFDNDSIIAQLLNVKVMEVWSEESINYLKTTIAMFHLQIVWLKLFADIEGAFMGMEQHLNKYLDRLLKRNQASYLSLDFFKGNLRFLNARKREWRDAVRYMHNLIMTGKQETMVPAMLAEMHNATKQLTEAANSASRGFSKRSELNDKISEYGLRLQAGFTKCEKPLAAMAVNGLQEQRPEKIIQHLQVAHRKENAAWRMELKEEKLGRKQAEEDAERLRAQNVTLKDEKETVQKELDDCKETLQQKEKEGKELEEQKSANEKEKEDLQAKLTKLKEQKSVNKKEKEKLQAKLHAQEVVYARLEARLESVETHNAKISPVTVNKRVVTPFGVSQQDMPTVPMINRSDSHTTENGSAHETYRAGFFTDPHMPTRRLSMESGVTTEKTVFQYSP